MDELITKPVVLLMYQDLLQIFWYINTFLKNTYQCHWVQKSVKIIWKRNIFKKARAVIIYYQSSSSKVIKKLSVFMLFLKAKHDLFWCWTQAKDWCIHKCHKCCSLKPLLLPMLLVPINKLYVPVAFNQTQCKLFNIFLEFKTTLLWDQ